MVSHVHAHPFDTLCEPKCPAYGWPDSVTRQRLSSSLEHKHTSGNCYAIHQDPMPAYQLQPWEVVSRDEAFDAQGVTEQRDELLAAVGLLVEFILNTHTPLSLMNYPLMKVAVDEMGHRYGPWSR